VEGRRGEVSLTFGGGKSYGGQHPTNRRVRGESEKGRTFLLGKTACPFRIPNKKIQVQRRLAQRRKKWVAFIKQEEENSLKKNQGSARKMKEDGGKKHSKNKSQQRRKGGVFPLKGGATNSFQRQKRSHKKIKKNSKGKPSGVRGSPESRAWRLINGGGNNDPKEGLSGRGSLTFLGVYEVKRSGRIGEWWVDEKKTRGRRETCPQSGGGRRAGRGGNPPACLGRGEESKRTL